MIQVARRTNNDFFKSFLPAVNSPPAAHREHAGTTSALYRPYEEYAIVQRRAEKPLPPEPLERKKDKKWSIGKLFRRKKKGDSGTSSESDEGVSSRSLAKKKSKKKKRCPAVNNFDHVVIRDTRRAQSLAKPNVLVSDFGDDGVLSDPSAGFISYRAKAQELYGASKESLNYRDDTSAKTSLETPSRKSRKGRLKARVEALRNSVIGNSSSDEDSLKSSNSSMVRFRSDDSLMRSRDNSLSKRSRSARNERYIKRLSRDDENQLNKEAELIQQGYTKAEVELLTRTPTSQSSGYGTCKREQATKPKNEHTYINELTRRPLKSESISSFPSTQSYPSSINFNAKVNNEHINYSIQYPGRNVNREPVYANGCREGSVDPCPENIISVKFPLGNVTNVKREDKIAPTPPPRDMKRKVTTPVSMYYDNSIAVPERFNNANALHGVPNNDFARIMRRSQERSSSYGPNGLRRPISNSEDHIAMMNGDFLQNLQHKSEQPRRPASVSAEPKHYGLYMNTPPWRKKPESNNIIKPEPVQLRNDYLYFADQSPRSRKPISIKSSQNGLDNQYLSDSQNTLNANENIVYRKPRNASEFWKKIDDEEKQRRKIFMFANSRSKSECANQAHLGPKHYPEQYKFHPNNCTEADIQNKNKVMRSVDTTDSAEMWKATTEYKRALTVEPVTTTTPKTHTRHKSDTFITNTNQILSDEEKTSERRKSTNLDDALNELEAIYNSLGLGDEDLLDRAERRELLTPRLDHYNDWNGNDNDSVQLRSQPTTPLRSRRSTLPDKLQDDMAFRRMNSLTKDKQNNKDSQAQISYMLASPVYVPYASDDDWSSIRGNEPDVVHDDVVYRNITQMNKRLKTLDPQPPFGIPIGPVSPAPQSDYLHATPENKTRSRFIPRKSPDIVSDDLAYRNLRKDNRHSSVFGSDDYTYRNNNQNYTENTVRLNESPNSIKKKRAVRSLSANIFTMIQKEIDDALNMSQQSTLQKTHSSSDVMRRLRETFENNDQERTPRNKVKQRHNTVNLYVNNTHSPTHHITKDDSFIHGDEKYLAKPPSCDKSKSSSPSNRSPQVSKRSSRDEFQHVLSMLAQEAMDTSNKLGVALAELDKNRNTSEKKTDIQTRILDSRTNFLNNLTGNTLTSNNFDAVPPRSAPEIKHVKVYSEIIEPSTQDHETKGKKTEDSLLAISDQLHKVEDKLKHSMEKELKFKDESLNIADYIGERLIKDKTRAQETLVVDSKEKQIPDIVSSNVQNDSSPINKKDNVANNGSITYNSQDNSHNEKRSLNPFLNVDEKCDEINELEAFKELKDGISNLIAGISQVNEKFFVPKPEVTLCNGVKENKMCNISEINEKLNQVSQQQQIERKTEVPKRASVNLSIYEDDLEIKREATDSTEYNSSEELATIFKLDNNAHKDALMTKEGINEIDKNVRDELSSPKLVQSMNQQLRRLSVDHTDDRKPSQSNSLPNNVVPWRTKRQNSQTDNRGDNTQQKQHWHDSGTLMLAFSYTMMFSQHLADMDWLTLLGLLLAVITIVAMLLI